VAPPVVMLCPPLNITGADQVKSTKFTTSPFPLWCHNWPT